ncbi:MAG: phosphoenolpyruvate carboxykinase [Verrucomicrobia bacterium RIFCSPHIGHO2_12_FULL_41_10]|nr:MAG: phosphoenolpyruvate carboxykinase [Verrucomicrobia bacterium RIFCSPHIGHO2_12_FULL_41_10]
MKNSPSSTPFFGTLGQKASTNEHVLSWVKEITNLTTPENVFWCNGSEEEKSYLTEQAVAQGVLTPLDQKKWPGCHYHRSNPNDVARVEQCTFICTDKKDDVGPTNNWAAPQEMLTQLHGMLRGAMKGRTLFVIPYLMGPANSPMTKVGIEITDSIYVVLNMRIMTRMGEIACKELGTSNDFNRGVHSMLDCDPEKRLICHFPQENTIISVGSAYGGNVLLGKKCLALRIGSFLGHDEGWMAEHMLLLCLENPQGEKTYVAAAFPSACGKTNFAMMIPPKSFKGWKITTIGDDIAWMKPGDDGRLYAINPEGGYFGVVPGTNEKSNPNAMRSMARDTIFTNVAITPDGDIWWEGKDNPPPKDLIDWKGNPWTPESGEKAAHPNSRFTAPMKNNPALAVEAEWAHGVPISAIIFGGRRADTMPLVFEAFNWDHGVYLGATVGSEMTAAAAGTVGQVRRDPMAMLPFCGYNMGDYFKHWLEMRRHIKVLPHIFHVNWFRKDKDGNFLWPGYGENIRALQWMVERCQGTANALETPIGWMPRYEDMNMEGFEDQMTSEQFSELQKIDPEEWKRELILQDELFIKLHRDLPKELTFQRELLISRF